MKSKIYAYILDELYNELVVIDIERKNVVYRINRGNVSGGGGIAITYSGRRVYCTNNKSRNVSCIDTCKNKVIGPPIALPMGYIPADIAIDPGDKYAYVICFPEDKIGNGKLFKISTLTNKVQGEGICVGGNPTSIAIAPNGKTAYIANNGTSDVSVINLENNVEYRIPDIMNPNDIVVGYSGSLVYVVGGNEWQQGILYIIQPNINKSYPLVVSDSNSFQGIEFVQNYRYAYVTDINGFVRMIDLLYLRPSQTKIPVGKKPIGLSREPLNRWTYVVNSGSGSISVIETHNNKVEDTIYIGANPCSIAIGLIPKDVQANLTITKKDNPDPVKVDNNLKYTVVVENQGLVTATGVKVVDTLPESVDYILANPSEGYFSVNKGVINWYLGTMYSRRAAAIDIVVVPKKEGIITNKAIVTCNEAESNLNNNTAIEHTTVISNNVCIETTKIFDSCMKNIELDEDINLPCGYLAKIIYLIMNNNKKYVSCSVKDIRCTVVNTSEPDNEGRVDATFKIEGSIALKVKMGDSFLDIYEEPFSIIETLTLYAPTGTKVNCEVDNVSCEFDKIINCVEKCVIKMTLIAKSKALVTMKIPYVGECNKVCL